MKNICYNLTFGKIWKKISLWGTDICTRVWLFVHGYVQTYLGYVHLYLGYVHLYPHKEIYKVIYKNKKKTYLKVGKRKKIFLLARSNFKKLILQDLERLQTRSFYGMGAHKAARTHEGRTGKRMKTILRRFLKLSSKRICILSGEWVKVSGIKGKVGNLRL